jgi:hypothetical protein
LQDLLYMSNLPEHQQITGISATKSVTRLYLEFQPLDKAMRSRFQALDYVLSSAIEGSTEPFGVDQTFMKPTRTKLADVFEKLERSYVRGKALAKQALTALQPPPLSQSLEECQTKNAQSRTWDIPRRACIYYGSFEMIQGLNYGRTACKDLHRALSPFLKGSIKRRDFHDRRQFYLGFRKKRKTIRYSQKVSKQKMPESLLAAKTETKEAAIAFQPIEPLLTGLDYPSTRPQQLAIPGHLLDL